MYCDVVEAVHVTSTTTKLEEWLEGLLSFKLQHKLLCVYFLEHVCTIIKS